MLTAVLTTGCSTVVSKIPSFWDANQSAKIVDIAVAADNIDCAADQHTQAQDIQQELAWFRKYSETKGPRQQDMLNLVEPMEETVNDWVARSGSQPGASQAYCEIKKTVIQEQSTRAAQAVQARF